MANNPKQLGALSITPTQPYVKPRIKQDKAAWGVVNDGFYDENDKFWNPGQMLYFSGEPNLNLHPMNKKAYDKMQEFLDKLDLFAMDVAKKNSKDFIPQPRQKWNEDEEVEMPQIENVMGVPKSAKNDEIR